MAFFYAWLWFGPAILFAAVLILMARSHLSGSQKIAVFLISLFAYYIGVTFVVQLQFRRYLGEGIHYISPAIGAATLLGGLALLKWRCAPLFHPFVLGTVFSWLSAIPLWLDQFTFWISKGANIRQLLFHQEKQH